MIHSPVTTGLSLENETKKTVGRLGRVRIKSCLMPFRNFFVLASALW